MIKKNERQTQPIVIRRLFVKNLLRLRPCSLKKDAAIISAPPKKTNDLKALILHKMPSNISPAISGKWRRKKEHIKIRIPAKSDAHSAFLRKRIQRPAIIKREP